METLPIDIKKYIGKMVWQMHIADVHQQLNEEYKIGISTLLVRRAYNTTPRRRRKIFAFIPFIHRSAHITKGQNGIYKLDLKTSKMYELSKGVVSVPEAKSWERNPYNYRMLESSGGGGVSPSMFCIRNGNSNVGFLPRRYIYSRPMNPEVYTKLISNVKRFIELYPDSKSLRAGDL